MLGPAGPPEGRALVGRVRAALALERGDAPEPGDLAAWPAGPSLRDVAAPHCVAPVLAPWRDQLRCRAGDADWLEGAHGRNARRALAAARTLGALSEAMSDAGVRMLALKGLPLAMRSAGDLTGRFCGDLDVLVEPARLNEADAVLASLGITRPSGLRAQPFDGPYAAWVRVLKNEQTYLPASAAKVDLHWGLTKRGLLPLSFETLWQGRRQVDIAGTPVAALGDIHDALFVSVHLAKHGGGRLQWIVDVARLVQVLDQSTWDGVVDLAATVGLQRSLGVALALASGLGAEPRRVPAPSRRDAVIVDGLTARAWSSTLEPTPERTVRTTVGHLWHWSRLSKRLAYKVRLGVSVAMPVALFDELHLPRPLAPLYLVLRPALRRRRFRRRRQQS